MRHWTLLSLMFLVLARPAFGQTGTDVLVGWEAVDARVLLDWDDDIEGYDDETLQVRAETAFQRELRSAGIPVSDSPMNFLWLTYNLMAGTGDQAGLVIYSIDLEFSERAATEHSGTTVWAKTWVEPGSVGTVGQNNLLDTLESDSRSAAQSFANAWLAANPR